PRDALSISDRRSDGNHAGGCPLRLAAHGFLFCSRPLPLRAHRRGTVRTLCRLLLLVPESLWPNAQSETRTLALLVIHDRFPFDVLHDAHSRPVGPAPAV